MGIERVAHMAEISGETSMPEEKESEILLEMGNPSQKTHHPANSPPQTPPAQPIHPTNNKPCGSIAGQALHDPNGRDPSRWSTSQVRLLLENLNITQLANFSDRGGLPDPIVIFANSIEN